MRPVRELTAVVCTGSNSNDQRRSVTVIKKQVESAEAFTKEKRREKVCKQIRNISGRRTRAS